MRSQAISLKLSMCPGSRLPTVDKVQGCEGRINDNVPRKHTHTHTSVPMHIH
jgi:hypothetical protein